MQKIADSNHIAPLLPSVNYNNPVLIACKLPRWSVNDLLQLLYPSGGVRSHAQIVMLRLLFYNIVYDVVFPPLFL
nr:MAG TPA: hypothetical protein [Caudoviricetes sp.]